LTVNHLVSDPALILPFLLRNALDILGAAAILVVGFWLAGRAERLAVAALRRSRHTDEMLQGFFGSIARYFVLTVTVLAVLSQFGIQTTSLVAVLGAASLAIGLALQGTLTNLAAGVMLLIFRPFRIGHSVNVGGNGGVVHGLSLFWTEIVTDSNTQVIIPNGSVWGQAIRNMSVYPQPVATAQLRVPVPEGWRPAPACARILDITRATPHVLPEPAPSARLDRAGPENALQIEITFAPEGDTAASIRHDILRAIDEQMEHPGGAGAPRPGQDPAGPGSGIVSMRPSTTT
jgi:small conductance mechanosensitive channel